MARKASISTSKKKAWTAFSLYIRTRDCVEYAKKHPELNNGLEAPCTTCGRVYPLAKLQAGHFVSGRTNAVLFDERGVNSQCYGCNVKEHGNITAYWVWMERKYGREIIDELMAQRHVTLKRKAWEYDEITEKYKQKLKELV